MGLMTINLVRTSYQGNAMAIRFIHTPYTHIFLVSLCVCLILYRNCIFRMVVGNNDMHGRRKVEK